MSIWVQPKQPCSFSRAGFTRIYHPENFGPLIWFGLRFAVPPLISMPSIERFSINITSPH
jgi:hypothetical protein